MKQNKVSIHQLIPIDLARDTGIHVDTAVKIRDHLSAEDNARRNGPDGRLITGKRVDLGDEGADLKLLEAHAHATEAHLSPAQKKTIHQYTTDPLTMSMLEKMRSCPPDFKCVKVGSPEHDMMQGLTSALRSAPALPRPVTVRRTMELDDYYEISEYVTAMRGLIKSGGNFQFPAITSTAASANGLKKYKEITKMNDNVTLVIKAKNGLLIDNMAGGTKVNEVLLRPGLNYRVLGMVRQKGDEGFDKFTFHLEEV